MKSFLILFLFLSSSCFAQVLAPPKSKAACKTAFAVAQRTADSPDDAVAALSKQQNDWWEQKGAKKYPDFCLVFLHEADYLLVWEDRILQRQVTRKVSATHNDPLEDRSGMDTGLNRDGAHYITDTVMEEVGSVRIYKRAIGQDGKQIWQPIASKDSVRNATGWFTDDIIISGSPTRRAMESSLKFIRKHR
jgi:hypothetical protein